MPTTFADLTALDLEMLLDQSYEPWMLVNRKLYDGDHWQDATIWTGPQPGLGDRNRQVVMDEIFRGLVTKNAVGEVVNRHTSGVFGREPGWRVTLRRPLAEEEEPTAAEAKLIDEAESALTEWWDDKDILSVYQNVMSSAQLSGRGMLRFYVPPEMLSENGQIITTSLSDAFKRIYLQHPEDGASTMLINKRSMQRAGIYSYKETDLTSTAETGTKYELVFLRLRTGGVVETVIRMFDGETQDANGVTRYKDYAYPLNGMLLMHDLCRPLLVTEQVRRLQCMLNVALTMAQRNVILGGFLERIITNGQLPGRWEADPNNPNKQRFVPEPMPMGASTVTWIAGLKQQNADGTSSYATPQVIRLDPVSVQTFDDTVRLAYRSLLEETHQLHALIAGDATPSGEARRQARADFEADLNLSATRGNRALRWGLETALTMAALFSGNPKKYEALRIDAQCRVDSGPLSAEEQKLAIEQRNANVISLETAIGRSDVDDVDAEKERIKLEKQEAIEEGMVAEAGDQQQQGPPNPLKKPADQNNGRKPPVPAGSY